MKLKNAIAYHANTKVDCWGPTTGWVEEATKGAFAPFDRFITERSFGQKKRIFMVNPKVGPIPDEYTVMRNPRGRLYIIAAHNEDMLGQDSYNDVYLIQEAPLDVEICRFDTATSAAGVPKASELKVVSTTFGDMERLTSAGSEHFPTVDYTSSVVTLPHGTQVSTDNELRIGGILYDVTEVWATLRTVIARVNKRAGNV